MILLIIYRIMDDQASVYVMTCFSDTPDICDCDYYTKFWCRWEGQTKVTLGTGDPGTVHNLAEVEDTEDPYTVSVLSIAQWNTSSGTWMIPGVLGEYREQLSESTTSYDERGVVSQWTLYCSVTVDTLLLVLCHSGHIVSLS